MLPNCTRARRFVDLWCKCFEAVDADVDVDVNAVVSAAVNALASHLQADKDVVQERVLARTPQASG